MPRFNDNVTLQSGKSHHNSQVIGNKISGVTCHGNFEKQAESFRICFGIGSNSHVPTSQKIRWHVFQKIKNNGIHL